MSDRAGDTTEVTTAGRAAAGAAIVLWSSGNVLIKDVDLPGVQLAFWRLVLGSVVYGGLLLAAGGRITLSGLRKSVPTGLTFTFQIAFFFVALKSTTIANAAVIAALSPLVLLVVAARRFGERIDPVAVVAGVGALGGVALVVFGSSSTPVWSARGDLMAVVAMLLFAAYFAAAKSARAELGAFELQTMAIIIGAVALAPVAVVDAGGFDVPTASEWGWIALVLAIPGSGHLLMNWSHKYTHLTFTSMLTLAVPALSALLAAWWLSESLDAVQVGGIVLVVLALAVVVGRDVTQEPDVAAGIEDP